MAEKNYYEILEVAEDATQEAIRESYLRQMRFFHPDRYQHNEKDRLHAEEKSKAINDAYDTLKDPGKRQVYNFTLSQQRNQSRSSASQTPGTGSTSGSSTQTNAAGAAASAKPPPQEPPRQEPPKAKPTNTANTRSSGSGVDPEREEGFFKKPGNAKKAAAASPVSFQSFDKVAAIACCAILGYSLLAFLWCWVSIGQIKQHFATETSAFRWMRVFDPFSSINDSGPSFEEINAWMWIIGVPVILSAGVVLLIWIAKAISRVHLSRWLFAPVILSLYFAASVEGSQIFPLSSDRAGVASVITVLLLAWVLFCVLRLTRLGWDGEYHRSIWTLKWVPIFASVAIISGMFFTPGRLEGTVTNRLDALLKRGMSPDATDSEGEPLVIYLASVLISGGPPGWSEEKSRQDDDALRFLLERGVDTKVFNTAEFSKRKYRPSAVSILDDFKVERRMPQTTIPRLLGQTTSKAEELLEAAHLNLSVDAEGYSSDVSEGLICKTLPPSGEKVDEGSSVKVWVSKGPRIVRVPSLLDKNLDAAKSLLNNKNLHLTVEASEYMDSIPAGIIFRTLPEAETEIKEQSEVKVWVSKGPPPVVVPALVARGQKELPALFGRYEKAMLSYDKRALAALYEEEFFNSRKDPWDMTTLAAMSGLNLKLVSYEMSPQLDSLTLDGSDGIICRCKGTFMVHGKDASGKVVLTLQTDYDNNGYWKVIDGQFRLYNLTVNSGPEKRIRVTRQQFERMGGSSLRTDAYITADL